MTILWIMAVLYGISFLVLGAAAMLCWLSPRIGAAIGVRQAPRSTTPISVPHRPTGQRRSRPTPAYARLG